MARCCSCHSSNVAAFAVHLATTSSFIPGFLSVVFRFNNRCPPSGMAGSRTVARRFDDFVRLIRWHDVVAVILRMWPPSLFTSQRPAVLYLVFFLLCFDLTIGVPHPGWPDRGQLPGDLTISSD